MQDLWVVIHIPDGYQSKWPAKQNGCQNVTMTCERQILKCKLEKIASDVHNKLQISKT